MLIFLVSPALLNADDLKIDDQNPGQIVRSVKIDGKEYLRNRKIQLESALRDYAKLETIISSLQAEITTIEGLGIREDSDNQLTAEDSGQ